MKYTILKGTYNLTETVYMKKQIQELHGQVRILVAMSQTALEWHCNVAFWSSQGIEDVELLRMRVPYQPKEDLWKWQIASKWWIF